MSEATNREMLDAITEATEKITAIRQHEILRKSFRLVRSILDKCWTPDEPWNTTKVLTENHADLKTAAELLAELEKEVIQLQKAKIVFDATQAAKDVYTRNDDDEDKSSTAEVRSAPLADEDKSSTDIVPGYAPAREE